MQTGAKFINGQVAVVTGGGRGIGRAIDLALAKGGATVAVTARSREQLDETVALIQGQGGQAIAFALNVTDGAAVERMVSKTTEQFGPIDLLVNNAGVGGDPTVIWEANADDWWRVLEVNLRGPFLFARAVLKGMIARRCGRIINIASLAAVSPLTSLNTSYSASKAALVRFTDCLAETVKEYGVSTFAISPGLVRTQMTQDVPLFKNIPDSAWTPAERAGELCVFLATGNADRLSGRYLHVNDDIDDLVRRVDEIVANDLYALRYRK